MRVLAFASFEDDGTGILTIARSYGVRFIGANAPGVSYLVDLVDQHEAGDAPGIVGYATIQEELSLGGANGVLSPQASPNLWTMEFAGAPTVGAFRVQFILWELAPGATA